MLCRIDVMNVGRSIKKESNFKRSLTLCWVAGGTRTHDIQNHNLTL